MSTDAVIINIIIIVVIIIISESSRYFSSGTQRSDLKHALSPFFQTVLLLIILEFWLFFLSLSLIIRDSVCVY